LLVPTTPAPELVFVPTTQPVDEVEHVTMLCIAVMKDAAEAGWIAAGVAAPQLPSKAMETVVLAKSERLRSDMEISPFGLEPGTPKYCAQWRDFVRKRSKAKATQTSQSNLDLATMSVSFRPQRRLVKMRHPAGYFFSSARGRIRGARRVG
jgi:hypothetical protein